MKTSEQMTMDVLKRRDEALKAKRSPVRRIAMAAVPCAAVLAVTATVVGVNSIHGRYVHQAIAKPENAGVPELGRPDIATAAEPEDFIPQNPNAGKYRFNVVSGSHLASRFQANEERPDYEELSKPEYTLIPYTAEGLNRYYGIEFDRLSRLHPEWNMSTDHPLGIYCRDEYNEDFASRTFVCTTNTLNYTTPSGAEIYVTAQQGRFFPEGEKTASNSGNTREIGGDSVTIFDENGNEIEATSAGYVPENNNASKNDKADDTITTIILMSMDEPECLTYLDMGGTCVKIYANGLSGAEFINLVKEYAE